MNPPHFAGPYSVHMCPESYLTGRTRWLLWLFRNSHAIRSTGFGGATIERLSWPHADKFMQEYFVVVQGFEVIHGELSQMIREASARSGNAPPAPQPPRSWSNASRR